MVIRRGEVWWGNLPKPRGSEPGYRRPVIVVQSDEFNQSSLPTAIVVAVTSNLRVAGAPGNVLLKAKQTGLPRDSVANVSQLTTMNRFDLTERIATLPNALMVQIDQGLRHILSAGEDRS